MVLKSLLRSMAKPSSASQPSSTPSPAASDTGGLIKKAAVRPSFTFAADGLFTTHDASFLGDPRFVEAYRLGAESGHRICAPEDLHIEWRVYVCCWAATHALKLGGDFVECGVSTGIVSRAVANYTDFGAHPATFWLLDTFDGIPLEQADEAEMALAQSKNDRHYFDCYTDVCSHFSRYGNVRVIRGRVPDSLAEVDSQRISYLHIDMNIAEPEVAAMDLLWDRLTPGAVVVLDDYGSLAHKAQKTAHDEFAKRRGVSILTLPTGQGLLLKP
jgi:hypothetical protein